MELSSTSADAAAVGSPTRAATLYRLEPRAAVVEELFHELMTQRDLRHTARRRVPSGATLLADLGDFTAVVTASDLFDGARATFLLEHDARLVSIVELLDGAAWIRVAGATSEQVVEVAEQLRELLLAPEPDEQLTRVTFWSKADCAPPDRSRATSPPPIGHRSTKTTPPARAWEWDDFSRSTAALTRG